MKFSEEVLLEIVDAIRNAFVEEKDVSQQLRDFDLDIGQNNTLVLSDAYKKKYRNADV